MTDNRFEQKAENIVGSFVMPGSDRDGFEMEIAQALAEVDAEAERRGLNKALDIASNLSDENPSPPYWVEAFEQAVVEAIALTQKGTKANG